MEVDKKICIGCGTCVNICPVEAIKMVSGKAEIDKKICINCGSCKNVCPVEAIEDK